MYVFTTAPLDAVIVRDEFLKSFIKTETSQLKETAQRLDEVETWCFNVTLVQWLEQVV